MQGPIRNRDDETAELGTPVPALPIPPEKTAEAEVLSQKDVVIDVPPRSEEEGPFATDPHDPEPHRQKVTLSLIRMLAGLILIHYLFMFFLDWNGKKMENVSSAFNATLPVIAGLAGSAVTYYFTRRSDK